MEIYKVVLLIAAATTIVKNLNDTVPVSRRKKIIKSIRNFADSDHGRVFTNALTIAQCVGMVILGFLYAFIMFVSHSNPTGIMSGLGMFAAFAMIAISFLKMGYRVTPVSQ